MNSLPKTVTRQCRDCDLNPSPSAPESSTLTTRLPSQPSCAAIEAISIDGASRGPSAVAELLVNV